MSVFAYYQTHWDREWYQPFREYQVRLAEVVDEILGRLEAAELPCFMLDGQTVLLQDYLTLRPEHTERISALVQSGRLTLGPWFVMPDEFLVSGESLIRNLQKGIALSKAWGCSAFTGYLPDTFGHSIDMPKIFQNCGIDTAIIWRGLHPSFSEFLWQSLDGSTVLTYHLADGYFENMLHDPDLTLEERKRALLAWQEKAQSRSLTHKLLLPIGGDHLGPISPDGRKLLLETFPELQETTPERFLGALKMQLKQSHTEDRLETYRNDFRDCSNTFILPGVYSARLYLKQANRRLEHRMTRKLEPLIAMNQALAKLYDLPNSGVRSPKHELNLAWELLLLNHPHDSICGCSVDAVHRENENRYEQVGQLCDAVERRQRFFLNTTLKAASDEWLLTHWGDLPYRGVVPAVAWTDSPDDTSLLGVIQVERDETVLLDRYLNEIEDVPQSHKTMRRVSGYLWVEDIPPKTALVISKDKTSGNYRPVGVESIDGEIFRLSNGLLSVQVALDGSFVIESKTLERIYEDMHRILGRPDQGDSYNGAPTPGSFYEFATLEEIAVLASGPLKAGLLLIYRLRGMLIQTRVTLWAESSRLDFETEFIHQFPHYRLQVAFSGGAPVSRVFAEGHLGVYSRSFDPDYRIESHMPADAWQELETNTGPVQRFLAFDGQVLITEGLTEYEVIGSDVRLTLVRTFDKLSSAETGVRGAPAGPPLDTPEAQCLGRKMVARYAWMPWQTNAEELAAERKDWAEVYEETLRFYGVTQAEQGRHNKDRHPDASFTLIGWNNPHVVSSALYWSWENEGIILRLINPTGIPQPIHFSGDLADLTYGNPPLSPARGEFSLPENNSSLVCVNFLEEEQEKLSNRQKIELPPWAVKTFLFQIK